MCLPDSLKRWRHKMALVGLTKKKKEFPPEYESMTDIQQTLYRVCEREFEKANTLIQTATKASSLKKRDRTINKSAVTRIAAQELDKNNLTHSHMSEPNCKFLFDSIQRWNLMLEAEYRLSNVYKNTQAQEPTKADLRAKLKDSKKHLKDITREVYDYYVKSSMLDSKSELVIQVEKQKEANNKLIEKLVNSEATRETLVSQLAQSADAELDTRRLNKEVLRLQSILKENSIKF